MHPIYKKIITRSKKYAAHDENNVFKTGDNVRIDECRADLEAQDLEVLRQGAAPAAAA